MNKATNLLILRGVYPKDFEPNSIFNQNAAEETKPKDVYINMPRKFTGVDDWIKFSNLKCWHCDQIPTDYPKFIPKNISVEDDKITCCVEGHFDEWNCAASYIISEYMEEERWELLEALCMIEKQFSGSRKLKIHPAPKKTCMKQYCGNAGIDTDDYKNTLNRLNAEYDLSLYKMEHFKI